MFLSESDDAREAIVEIGVVIPSHARPAELAAALSAVTSSRHPPGWRVRLVVVENGSAVASQVAAAHGADYLHIPEGNASAARNAGASAVGSVDVLVFVDDDVVPREGWLAALIPPVLSGAAEVAVGSVMLNPRDKTESAIRRFFVDTSLAMDPLRPFIVGCNVAVTPQAFFAAGGFEPELGPGALGGHEDVLLGLQIVDAGGRITYVPEAEVEHVVPPSRMTRPALLSRAAAAGRGQGWATHHWHHAVPRFLRVRVLRSRLLLVLSAMARRNIEMEIRTVERYWRERQMIIEAKRPPKFPRRNPA